MKWKPDNLREESRSIQKFCPSISAREKASSLLTWNHAISWWQNDILLRVYSDALGSADKGIYQKGILGGQCEKISDYGFKGKVPGVFNSFLKK